MSDVSCPICGVTQKDKPLKEWKYSDTVVRRFKCDCGKMFNIYTGKNKTWTIPKSKL
ncbi:MAG: hypothetical protein R1F52_01200 [Candidatus Nitrosoabyssus spongiisocia]|nr:MAG: hypothetical protein R1F52_01200 [Nitrosopumilaceae archaeon AB1(1)]